jgi:hypothetical protein
MNFNHKTVFTTDKLFKLISPLVLTCAFLLLLSLQARAHTFHASLTRMDYNAEEKSIEVTIQVFAHDLETAIEKRQGKRVNLEKSPVAAKLMLDYLNDRFVLKNKRGEIQKLSWVGKEQSADSVWLYLETKSAEGLENARLENSLFFELHNDQVNLVTCREAGKKQDFAFKPGDAAKNIDFKAETRP